jgi:glycerophosphoryl diester phosphodiesterase
MSRVGRRNPLDRLVRAVRGWLRPADAPGRNGRAVLPIAHRGAAREAPENTIPAFRKALARGAAGIETDVCVTRDGHFVLFHDARPDDKIALVRQSLGEGSNFPFAPAFPDLGSKWRRPICELDFADVMHHYGYRRDGEGLLERLRGGKPRISIAPLEDLLGWVERNPRVAIVLLDLKLEADQADAAVRLHRRLADLFRRGKLPSGVEFRFLSVQQEVVEALAREERRGAPRRLRVSPDFEYPGVLDFVKRSGVRVVSMGCGQRAWPDFRDEVSAVVEARNGGVIDSVVTWTINEPAELAELVSRGVDGIVTDDVPALRKLAASA